MKKVSFATNSEFMLCPSLS